ncbi:MULTISPECIES: DsbA family protein [Priestia]|nr:DsbA family protein [Priestia aryabhattai]
MTKNNMMCDVETGICGVAEENEMEVIDFNQPSKKVTLYYVTDPICSHCWALEPVLNRFIAQYGHYFNFRTIMGGLLPSWDGFADVANGINGPADVAQHWREVGEHSRMPIDGSVWIHNPIHSSFPPSKVYKVIQKKESTLANLFLRKAREAVFVFNQNISEDQVLINIVNQIGLDGELIVKEAALPSSRQLLDQDFELNESLGVRGFPTIIMVNEENKGVKMVGVRSLENYVTGLKQVLSDVEKTEEKPVSSLAAFLEKESRLFSKEIEEMYDLPKQEVKSFIQKELPSGTYKIKDILGELYVEKN